MMELKSCAFTLIETLISLLLLTITLLGGMAFYFYSNQHLQTAFHRRVAAEIAGSKLEEIKEAGYGSLPHPAPSGGLWMGPISISIRDLPGYENIYVYDIDDSGGSAIDYKQVAVKVDWQDPGKVTQQVVRTDTYIIP